MGGLPKYNYIINLSGYCAISCTLYGLFGSINLMTAYSRYLSSERMIRSSILGA